MRRPLSIVTIWLCFLSCLSMASMASQAGTSNFEMKPQAQLVSYIYNQYLTPIADTVIGTAEPDTGDLEEVVIAVMGPTGSGKTTFINLASGSTLRTGCGVESCPSEIQIAQPFVLNGHRVTLIDTPGFGYTHNGVAEILEMIALFLATYYEGGQKLAGVIYTYRISDVLWSGISKRHFKMFRQLCGDSTLKTVVIAMNMWSEVSPELGVKVEAELALYEALFKPVVDYGGQILRHTNTRASAHAIISSIIDNYLLPLQIQQALIDQNMALEDTGAGEELNKDLKAQHREYIQEMESRQARIGEIIRKQDEETKRIQMEDARAREGGYTICRFEDMYM